MADVPAWVTGFGKCSKNQKVTLLEELVERHPELEREINARLKQWHAPIPDADEQGKHIMVRFDDGDLEDSVGYLPLNQIEAMEDRGMTRQEAVVAIKDAHGYEGELIHYEDEEFYDLNGEEWQDEDDDEEEG
jgi:hypothetical protein